MVKPKSKQTPLISKQIEEKEIDQLADKLADKPYGQDAEIIISPSETLERITITVPQNLRYDLEEVALKRKRIKKKNASISAIIREALQEYMQHL